jgi:uncharacterized protein
MPEYLAPGVYVEEVSFRAKTIEGVSTSTAGLIGAARFGPTRGEPPLITSFADFERIYGALDPLEYADETEMTNFLAHGVRAFFEEGGSRCYVTRIFQAADNDDGIADFTVDSLGSPPAGDVTVRARFPGSGGNVTVTFVTRVGQNMLASEPLDPGDLTGDQIAVLRGVSRYDTVWITDESSPVASPPGSGALYWAEPYFSATLNRTTWRFHDGRDGAPLELASFTPGVDQVRVITVNAEVTYPGQFPRFDVWNDLALHPAHPNSLSNIFSANPSSRQRAISVPIIFDPEADSGPEIGATLLGQPRAASDRPRILRKLGLPTNDTTTDLSILATLGYTALGETDRRYTVVLDGGNDGQRVGAAQYEGQGDDDPAEKSGLKTFEDVMDISIVAAPGYSFDYDNTQYQPQAQQIMRHLISHCERMRYRIAVLDSANGQTLSEVRAYRGQVDSKHAALYYPWLTIFDPVTEQELNLPPSGFVAGIYARNDVENGVHKAPANESVRQAIGLEFLLNKAQQDVLNPEAINCFRLFAGRGIQLWGARVITSDPEWKYVNLRRYFAYLERSIEIGTQWAVFENNNEPLWANIRRTVEDFLYNEWKSNRLMGEKPADAYFVRCDRSTMTQNDLDNGRLICLIGVAPVRPAEFVIFRIGQFTADSRQ